MKKTIALIVIIFVAALVVSMGIMVVLSPDFKGFRKEPLNEPTVTWLSGENSESEGPAGAADTYNWKEHPVFVIGDSLTLGANKEITKAVDGVTVDAKTGRNMNTGLSILQGWEDAGAIPDDAIIVVCLAHNIIGSTVGDAQKVVDMIKPGQSLIMMTGHGNSNMDPINEFIRNLPLEYSYITVADWDATIAQSPRLLSDDGIHIGKRQGNELYAYTILRALEETRPMP